MMESQRIPGHNVSVFDRAILVHPDTQSVLPLAIRHVGSGGVKFIRLVRRNPELMLCEGCDLCAVSSGDINEAAFAPLISAYPEA